MKGKKEEEKGNENGDVKAGEKLKTKEYDKELAKLHVELVKLQEWVKFKRLKVCVVFEGRDGAGKGGVIKAITERVSPRVFRVVALPPRRIESKHRYMPNAMSRTYRQPVRWSSSTELVQPGGGRAGNGLLYRRAGDAFSRSGAALREVVGPSRHHPSQGRLEVSPEEQTRRLEGRNDDGRKIWKLSPMDLQSYSRWDDYTKARDEMFAASDTPWAPWYVAKSDDKKRARLNIITHLLSRIPCKEAPRVKVELPKRQKEGKYKSPDFPLNYVPEVY